MIIKTEHGDIFQNGAKHIVFAINTEGYNDAGFAGMVARGYWPELANCGEHELGTVLSKTVGNRTFHALVCHSLKEGWGSNQAEVIRECFDNIPTDDEISSIAIGAGFIGALTGADFRQIVYGMNNSTKKISLNCNYSIENVRKCCEEEHAKTRKLGSKPNNN